MPNRPVVLSLLLASFACAQLPSRDPGVEAAATAPASPGFQAPELRFPRTPALSPDGSLVAFSHQGDIWVAEVTGGPARRLTAHPSYDGRPKWSPDGRWIAFLGNRHGNFDLFVMPAEGGRPERLTWDSENESLHGWMDGERLLIGATRERRYSRRDQGAWVAWRDGRTPTLFGDWPMKNPALSPDGRWLAYERGHGDPRRRGYRGSASSALWLYDLETGEHRELTRFEGNDLEPMWSGDGSALYFLSDRPCPGNESGRDLGLWRIRRDGGEPSLVWHPGGRSLRYPEISRDGRFVVAELDDGLVRIETSSGHAEPLPVHGSLDTAIPAEIDREIKKGAEDLAVSPDGESVAFVARGDIYVLRKHEKIRRAVRVTEDPNPDYGPVWVEDGKTLLFVSERDGNGEVYRARPETPETPFWKSRSFTVERVTETPEDESGLSLSPDGKTLAWVQGQGRLVVGDPGTLEVRRVITDGFEPPDFDWSPDSAWLAFSQVDNDFNYDIFLARVEVEGLDPATPGVEPWNLTRHPDDDTAPRWSPDGRKLAFTSRRKMLDETDVWLAWLVKGDAEMTEQERLEYEEELQKKKKAKKEKKGTKQTPKKEPEPGGAGKGAGGGQEPGAGAAGEPSEEPEGKENAQEEEEKKPQIEPVRIDFEDLPLRLHQVTWREGNETFLGWGEDSETLYFNATVGTRLTLGTEADTGFFSTKLFEKEQKKVEPSPVSSFTRHEKEIFYVRGGQVVGNAGKATVYPFSVRIREERRSLMQAVLEQAWRVLDRLFYDPGFHGHDWRGSLEKWRPIALEASTPEDFGLAINWMLGEMNASHMGFFSSSRSSAAETDRTETGHLGVLWDLEWPGPGRRVLEVLPGGPAAREASRLQPGDLVLEVDGRPYAQGDNWARLLAGTVEQETWLRVRRASGEEEDLRIRPTNLQGLRRALYRRSVERARRQVESSSDGRLGYVHIEGMDTGSLLEFERDLFRAGHGKDALIIDVRENGGGWTTDMLLAMLMVQDHAVTIPRGGGRGYPQGRRIFATWDKPVVVLCNENSYSNAEIFSWAIRTLKRGPLVGKQTYGAVISTGGQQLLDGSFVRVPFRGWYVNDGTMTNMELHGCPPDYPVENLPGDYPVERDRQLEKAVQVGLDLID